MQLSKQEYNPDENVKVKAVYRKAAANKKVYYDAQTALTLLGKRMYSKYRHVADTFRLFDEDRYVVAGCAVCFVRDVDQAVVAWLWYHQQRKPVTRGVQGSPGRNGVPPSPG